MQHHYFIAIMAINFFVGNLAMADTPAEIKEAATANLTNSNTDQATTASCTPDDPKKLNHWCLDAVSVPVQVQLTKNEDVSGTASLGTFIGWNVASLAPKLFQAGDGTYPGIYIGPFAGATSIPTTSTSTGTTGTATTTTSTAAGVDYGLGLVFNAATFGGKQNVHLGLFFGLNHTAGSNKYEYNDRPWIGFGIALPVN